MVWCGGVTGGGGVEGSEVRGRAVVGEKQGKVYGESEVPMMWLDGCEAAGRA